MLPNRYGASATPIEDNLLRRVFSYTLISLLSVRYKPIAFQLTFPFGRIVSKPTFVPFPFGN